jgi:hypothetical protein
VPGALIAMVLVSPVSASTGAVSDPAGDALYKAPGFMDVVAAALSVDGETYAFQMTVAGTIPDDPGLPSPANASIRWAFPIDADPATFPEGPPLPPKQPGPAEFIVFVEWDGSAFTANLMDRRPLLGGSDATITPLASTVSGSDVRVSVPFGLIGTSTFRWGAATVYASAKFDANNGWHFIDALQPFYN